jgi:hypothetical protein
MNKKLRNITLGALAAGMMTCSAGCAITLDKLNKDTESSATEAVTEQPKTSTSDSLIETELERIHEYWAENGSNCEGKEVCVAEGLRTYDLLETTGNNVSISENEKLSTTIIQSEIRHAAQVNNDIEVAK